MINKLYDVGIGPGYNYNYGQDRRKFYPPKEVPKKVIEQKKELRRLRKWVSENSWQNASELHGLSINLTNLAHDWVIPHLQKLRRFKGWNMTELWDKPDSPAWQNRWTCQCGLTTSIRHKICGGNIADLGCKRVRPQGWKTKDGWMKFYEKEHVGEDGTIEVRPTVSPNGPHSYTDKNGEVHIRNLVVRPVIGGVSLNGYGGKSSKKHTATRGRILRNHWFVSKSFPKKIDVDPEVRKMELETAGADPELWKLPMTKIEKDFMQNKQHFNKGELEKYRSGSSGLGRIQQKYQDNRAWVKDDAAARKYAPWRPTSIAKTSWDLTPIASLKTKVDDHVALLRLKIEKAKEKKGKTDVETLHQIDDLAKEFSRLGRFGEAEPLYKETFEARQEKYGEKDIQTLTSKKAYAHILLKQGKRDEGTPVWNEVFEGLREYHSENLAKMYPRNVPSEADEAAAVPA